MWYFTMLKNVATIQKVLLKFDWFESTKENIKLKSFCIMPKGKFRIFYGIVRVKGEIQYEKPNIFRHPIKPKNTE